jgi:hypothetical protein
MHRDYAYESYCSRDTTEAFRAPGSLLYFMQCCTTTTRSLSRTESAPWLGYQGATGRSKSGVHLGVYFRNASARGRQIKAQHTIFSQALAPNSKGQQFIGWPFRFSAQEACGF